MRNAGVAAATVQQAGGSKRGAALAAVAAAAVPSAKTPEAVAQVLGETRTPPNQASIAIQNLLSLQNKNLNTLAKRTSQAARLLVQYQRAFNNANFYNRSKLSKLQGETLELILNINRRRAPARPPPPPPRPGAFKRFSINPVNPFERQPQPRSILRLTPPPPTRVRQPGISAPRLPANEVFQRLLNETQKTTPPYSNRINGRNVYSTSAESTNLYSKNPNGTYYKLKTNINGKLVANSRNINEYVYRNSRFQKKN